MDRRFFLKTAGAASLSALASPSRAIPLSPADIYELHDTSLVTGTQADPTKVNEQKVQDAVDCLVMAMTGKPDRGQAWEAIFPGISASSKIGIKVNALKDNNAPQLATLKAMLNGFNDMLGGAYTVSDTRVFLFDNNLGISGSTSTNHVDGAYGSATLDGLNVWHGLDAYGGPTITAAGQPVHVSTKFGESDYSVNLLAPRRHRLYAGNLSGHIKNMMGAVSTSTTTYSALRSGTGSFHDNSNFQAYVDIFKNHFSARTHLYVGDYILIPRDESTNYYDKVECRLCMGTDVCAMDSYAVDILSKHYTVTGAVPEALAAAGEGTTSYNKTSVTLTGIRHPRHSTHRQRHLTVSHPVFGYQRVPLSVDSGHALVIRDVAGRQFRVLLVGPNGTQWDGRDAHGRIVSGGVYLIGPASGHRAVRLVLSR